jgi:hypothetical protein
MKLAVEDNATISTATLWLEQHGGLIETFFFFKIFSRNSQTQQDLHYHLINPNAIQWNCYFPLFQNACSIRGTIVGY